MIKGKLLSCPLSQGAYTRGHSGPLLYLPGNRTALCSKELVNESIRSLSGWWVNLTWMRRGIVWHLAAPRLASWHQDSLA